MPLSIVPIVTTSHRAGIAPWFRLGHAYYLKIADPTVGGRLVNPAGIVNTSREIATRLLVPAAGVLIRAEYEESFEVVTPARVRVFGRPASPSGAIGSWKALRNPLGEDTIVLMPSVADILIASGGFRATMVDPRRNYFLLRGCVQILVGVEVAADSSAGEAYLAMKLPR